ncbi:MAG TPA: hypothetical protein VHQ65_11640 [Thermoanaerobaculia bacterium]|nr:hypothetical protein [Thermoanaerobaculia bacterium]
MSADLLLLERTILADLEIIDGLYEEIGTDPVGADTEQERLIVLAYRLHTLYNAHENIFRNVAAAFENRLDERRGWHAQLLRRMTLDVSPVRPALLDDESFRLLTDLRQFRHVFRAFYGVRLDGRRLALVQQSALALRPVFRRQIEEFLGFLRSLRSP